MENRGVKVREMHRERTEGSGAFTEGTEVGLSTYPSQEGGGPAGHGQSKHSKTKHKKQQNTEVLKKLLVKNKMIDKNKNANNSFPPLGSLRRRQWSLRWHLLLSKVFFKKEKLKKNHAH